MQEETDEAVLNKKHLLSVNIEREKNIGRLCTKESFLNVLGGLTQDKLLYKSLIIG
jgi:hypothetical protein